MIVKYPIFGRDKDKWMFMIGLENELSSHLEVIDIENNEYIGWDNEGKLIEFFLDNNEIKVRCQSDESRLDELKQAIFVYARVARPKTPFTSDSKSSMSDLFKKVEEHINQGRLFYKISKKFV